MPQELPVDKVMRYISCRSVMPITLNAELTHDNSGVTLRSMSAYYAGPNLPHRKTKECLLSKYDRDFVKHSASCVEVMKIICYPTAIVTAILVGSIMVGINESNQSRLQGIGLIVVAVAIGLPLYVRMFKNLGKKVKLSRAKNMGKVVVPTADLLVDQLNKDLEGLSHSDFRVRLFLKAFRVQVRDALPLYSDKMFKMIDEYRLLNMVRDEDWSYLSMTGKIYSQYRSFKSLKALKKRREILKGEITSFGVPVLDHSGAIAWDSIVRVIYEVTQSGLDVKDYGTFKKLLSDSKKGTSMSNSQHTLFSHDKERINPLSQVEMRPLDDISINVGP
jgi:hypothetical protein